MTTLPIAIHTRRVVAAPRHYPDERAAAIEHLDFAIAEFQDMKMQPALERALGRKGLLKALSSDLRRAK